MSGRLLLPFLLLPMLAAAQDRILLMSGHVVDCRLLGASTLEIRYEIQRKDKLLTRTEPTENVFSTRDSLGREKVWYFQDTLFGNYFTVDQMRWFIKGEQDARDGYRPIVPMIGGFVVGAGLVMALDLEIMAIPIPMVYAGIMALPRVHVTRGSIRDPLMEGDPYYAAGYAQVGRTKRVVKTLISSAVGTAVGLAVRQLIINPNNPDTY
ncbi:MAG: hypothetical protein JNM31_11635 [Flavobacteriales bacterium]|nr:hypothetical protein [Flavobacteriales bacterium]